MTVFIFAGTLCFNTAAPAQGLSLSNFVPSPSLITDFAPVGAAFLTYLTLHEGGHYVMAEMAEAENVKLDFFTRQGGKFFLGFSNADNVDPEASLSYRMGGVAASSYLYEFALRQYRNRPSLYNRSLMLFSGLDFLWYSVWTFYVEGRDDADFDPAGISQETGLSGDTLVGIVAAQAALNAYRYYTGADRLLPYIRLEEKWAEMGFQLRFH